MKKFYLLVLAGLFLLNCGPALADYSCQHHPDYGYSDNSRSHHPKYVRAVKKQIRKNEKRIHKLYRKIHRLEHHRYNHYCSVDRGIQRRIYRYKKEIRFLKRENRRLYRLI